MSKFNSEPIDIVIPWVNPNDPVWKKDFEYWKQKETGNKDACRYRDWGFIKFVFRSIEENCPWCRYVFLVLSGPSQIPNWLNTNNPRLKIVYHNDYIPAEFLPTFNSNVIELFYSNIEELSENFILCNDDTFFCQKKTEDFFFKHDLPIMLNTTKHCSHVSWEHTLVNSSNILKQFFNVPANTIYYSGHLPVCYNKSLQQFILYKLNLNFMKQSKFRKSTDITHFTFLTAQGLTKHSIFDNTSRGIHYTITNTLLNLNFNTPMMCVNEGELSTVRAIKHCLSSLETHFTHKGFENE